MYNLWWVVIGVGILLGASLILAIISKIKDNNAFTFFWQNLFFVCLCTSIVCGLTLLLTILASISNQLDAKKEYQEYLYNRQMIEMVYNSGGYMDFENIGLNSKIIEVNQWISQVKASKAQYGNWSKYCVIDVDGLEYIVLEDK